MSLIDLFRKPLFGKIILTFWIVCSILIAFLLSTIDSIVNHNLYNFGLQFSVAWANPYWDALHLIYIFLAVPAILSVIALITGFERTGRDDRAVKKVSSTVSAQPQAASEHSVLIRCTHCKKVFSKPETILDFSNGKPRLANVCPYCEHVLEKPNGKSTDESVKVESEEEVEAR